KGCSSAVDEKTRRFRWSVMLGPRSDRGEYEFCTVKPDVSSAFQPSSMARAKICGANCRNKPIRESPGELLCITTSRVEAVLDEPCSHTFPLLENSGLNQKEHIV